MQRFYREFGVAHLEPGIRRAYSIVPPWNCHGLLSEVCQTCAHERIDAYSRPHRYDLVVKLQRDVWLRFWSELKNLFPLFRYLILQTETHAFCLALACAALIGFFPSCLVMLGMLKNVLHWDLAYDVMLELVQGYFLPGDRGFIIRNLEARFAAFQGRVELGSIFWVLLGAAAVFVPLEAGLNRLWHVHEDRPYWKNQIIGFSLTVVCTGVGLFFVLVSTSLHYVIGLLQSDLVRRVLSFAVIETLAAVLFVTAAFGLYRLLPRDWTTHVAELRVSVSLPAVGVLFVILSAVLHWIVGPLRFIILREVLNLAVNHLTTMSFFTVAIYALYRYLPNRKIEGRTVLPAAMLAGVLVEIVRIVYFKLAPGLDPTQGPFAISVTFLVLAYIETFVVLGCAFMASQRDRYPWIGFLSGRRGDPPELEEPGSSN